MPDSTPAPATQDTPAETIETTETTTETTEVPGGAKTTETATETTETVKPAGWGDDWREKYAEGHKEGEKVLARLKRYQSPKGAIDALIAAQNKIAAGEVRKPLPKNATPEQLTEWRKESGIPTTPGEYLTNMPDGLTVSENDKPFMTSFAEAMHAINAPPEEVHAALAWYNQWQQGQAETFAEADRAAKATAEDELRVEWGGDYRTNLNLALGVIARAPEEVASALEQAVLPDGTVLGNHPGALRWLADMAREINPAATIVPAGGDVGPRGIEDEIKTIEKFMREKRTEYNKDEGMQQRLQQLYAAREKLSSRSAA